MPCLLSNGSFLFLWSVSWWAVRPLTNTHITQYTPLTLFAQNWCLKWDFCTNEKQVDRILTLFLTNTILSHCEKLYMVVFNQNIIYKNVLLIFEWRTLWKLSESLPEYNPFPQRTCLPDRQTETKNKCRLCHRRHERWLCPARDCPAIVDKYTRTKMALSCGVDLS